MVHQLPKQLLFILFCLTSTVWCGRSRSLLQAQGRAFSAKLVSENLDAILFWNAVTLQVGANDYDTSIVSSPDQVGPTTTSRAFAIIHGAMYEAVNAFDNFARPLFKPGHMPSTKDVSKSSARSAAVMEAAYITLCAMYPKQTDFIKTIRKEFLDEIKEDNPSKSGITRGILVGGILANWILRDRQYDNSNLNITYILVGQPGYHQPDPTHPNQPFLSPQWGFIRPFVIGSGAQFRASSVVGNTTTARQQFLNSQRYIDNYNELFAFGSRTNSSRTADQTEIGIFWGYDGSPKLGVPPRLYNQIVRVIAIQRRNTIQQNARLFALVNYAMADAGIAAWETKYYYGFWRPIVGIRQGSGWIQAKPNWTPLGAPSDGAGDNFTPPFPSYVSGHSTFGSATFEMLRLFYGTDAMWFQFQSDEFNGVTKDSITGLPRSARTRQYDTFTQAENENFLSRIYLGVHWRFDQEEGQIMGRSIASYIFNKMA